MFENEVKLVRILSHAGVKGNFNYTPLIYPFTLFIILNILIGAPKFYDSFRISENESVLLMEKLGQCLFEILELEQRKHFPV